MRTIQIQEFARNIYENKTRAERIYRGLRITYTLIKYGSKAAAKVNPYTLAIEAIISVLDAFRSYIGYRKAQEVTKQLEHTLKAAQEEYMALQAELEEKFKTEKQHINYQIELMREKILKDQEKMKALKKIYDESGEYLKTISKIIKEHKRTYYDDEQLRNLEQKYIEAVHARMSITLTLIGG